MEIDHKVLTLLNIAHSSTALRNIKAVYLSLVEYSYKYNKNTINLNRLSELSGTPTKTVLAVLEQLETLNILTRYYKENSTQYFTLNIIEDSDLTMKLKKPSNADLFLTRIEYVSIEPIISFWNSCEFLSNIKFPSKPNEKCDKTVKTFASNFMELKDNTFFNNKHVTDKYELKNYTKEEIIKAIEELNKALNPEYSFNGRRYIPKNINSFLYTGINKKSWFLYFLNTEVKENNTAIKNKLRKIVPKQTFDKYKKTLEEYKGSWEVLLLNKIIEIGNKYDYIYNRTGRFIIKFDQVFTTKQSFIDKHFTYICDTYKEIKHPGFFNTYGAIWENYDVYIQEKHGFNLDYDEENYIMLLKQRKHAFLCARKATEEDFTEFDGLLRKEDIL